MQDMGGLAGWQETLLFLSGEEQGLSTRLRGLEGDKATLQCLHYVQSC